MKTPAEVCDAIEICRTIAHAIAWEKVGAVVAAAAFAYGVAMSVAFYVYGFRRQRTTRRRDTRR
jgi:uncharacterized protein (DUF2062 family)